ncbi:MAG: type II toxin-antitoxin system VapC family toxin [Leptolyngbyaceae cyanobacterium RU_5_1]|nr:type II toxin-antitoxin system VapC family toxin [Leptolyngbyaceae cyanobacterium RU_5_1]
MRIVFADTFYWVALINPADAWHAQVIRFSQSSVPFRICTTDEVLTEVLAFYSAAGDRSRQRAATLIRQILRDPNIQVMEQTHQSFLDGLELYEQRLDKGYSLTDCIAMNTMRSLNITEALTHDKHFAQEGFLIVFNTLNSV